jgi:hypothetical protein
LFTVKMSDALAMTTDKKVENVLGSGTFEGEVAWSFCMKM